jgi:hypothetical protein
MGKFIDLTRQRFGRLTVVKRVENYISPSGQQHAQFLCECSCDKQKLIIVRASGLKSGKTKSCGCITTDTLVERNHKHGLSKTRLYSIWNGMKDRCLNPNVERYKDYGGRGISIFQDWLDDFQSFYDWSMANGYSDELTIDRKNNSGNYCPLNCMWTDYETQAKNRRAPLNCKSGIPGISFHKSQNRWHAYIGNNGKRIYLGTYNNCEDAISTRKDAELKYWGKTNIK